MSLCILKDINRTLQLKIVHFPLLAIQPWICVLSGSCERFSRWLQHKIFNAGMPKQASQHIEILNIMNLKNSADIIIRAYVPIITCLFPISSSLCAAACYGGPLALMLSLLSGTGLHHRQPRRSIMIRL